MSKQVAVDHRRSRRRPILETFSIFVVIPKKGGHRLRIHDVSEMGIGFELDTEGESPLDFKLSKGETLDIQLYLNQSLFIPMAVKVVRIDEVNKMRRVGAEYNGNSEAHSKATKAMTSFLTMLDNIMDVAQVKEA